MLSEQGFTGLISLDEVAPEAMAHVAAFECGTQTLDDFLQQQAQDFHNDHLGHTSLIFHEDFDGLVGYITLSCDSIHLKTSEVGELGLAYDADLKTYPAIKIGRLAIHESLQGKGAGPHLLNQAIGELIDSKPIAAARILITDAVDTEQAISFYKKAGFEESYWAVEQATNHGRKGVERGTIKMIRDIYK